MTYDTQDKIRAAILALRPDAEFVQFGDALTELQSDDCQGKTGILWLDIKQTRPTDAEITAKLTDLFPEN